MSDFHYVDMFEDKLFSDKQAEIFIWYREQRAKYLRKETYQNVLVMPWGRRTGKTDGGVALFCEIIADELCDLADKIADGELDPWGGIGKTRAIAKKFKPHATAFVIAPDGRILNEVAGHMLNNFNNEASL